MEDKSWKTAISRKKLSGPMRYLKETGRLFANVLDYGCGKGFDADALGLDKYDPHFFPEFRGGGYEGVACVYVLHVIENPNDRSNVERRIMGKLVPGGDGYIAVRNDKKLLNGRTSRGTWQGDVEPSSDWQLIKTTAQFRMYHFRAPLVLEPCPFCDGTNIRSGHMSAMCMGVECMDCRAEGPLFNYRDITDDRGYTLPEYQHLDLDGLDQWLLHRAQLAWNRRG
jgi:hypothetical protein